MANILHDLGIGGIAATDENKVIARRGKLTQFIFAVSNKVADRVAISNMVNSVLSGF